MRLRCRGPDGQQIIFGSTLTGTSRVADLKQDIRAHFKVPSQTSIIVKSGYPPKVLNADESSLSECGLRDGEQLVMEIEASSTPAAAPIITQASPTQALISTLQKSSSVPTVTTDPKNSVSFGTDGTLFVREMLDDNSCLFRSIAYIFERDAEKHLGLRDVVTRAIRNNPFDYNEVVLGRPIDEYMAWILDLDSWGGAIELAIFADHYRSEIISIDVSTSRADRFGEGKGYDRVAFVLYSGIHYDALALSPLAAGEGGESILEFDITTFAPEDSEKMLNAAQSIARRWKEQHKFTDLANFTIKCGVCLKGFKGQREAQAHAIATGHTDFSEHS